MLLNTGISRVRLSQIVAPIVATSLAAGSPVVADEAPAATTSGETIRIDVNASQTKAISPDLIGIFFEDLNYAADGGLYAELVQNRSFEYSRADNEQFSPLSNWALLMGEGDKASIGVESATPLNANNQHYAVITIDRRGSADSVRLVNDGFGGIAVKKGQQYQFSIFARRLEGAPELEVVRLESKTGQILGSAKLSKLEGEWKQQRVTLEAATDSADARLVLTASGTGKVAIDMASLFPRDTFKGRTNGLRADLAQAIADLKPRFMRFPGGCIVHGRDVHNTYRWKETIGPVEERRVKPNRWGYNQSFGLGYFEYFQFCEDIGAMPLPVLPAGVTCQFQNMQVVPMAEMSAYVQDVIDLIEYANGPATSTWGAKRAAAGHPEPFNLKYVAIGNEEAITPEFCERFALIYDAVKAKHPEITLIGTSGPFHSGPDYVAGWDFANQKKLDMVDEHYYVPPAWLLKNHNFYDKYDRSKSKVYLGEYAAHDTGRRTTLRSALAEASYLTSLERNADIVQFASYAPLLGKLSRTQWDPNLIYFTNTEVVPTINYHVQQLFSVNGGDQYLATEVSQIAKNPHFGSTLFLGTWDTNAEFDDVRVTRGKDVAFNDDFLMRAGGDAKAWETREGRWAITDGVYKQTAPDQPALSRIRAQVGTGDYVYTLRARKLSGNEGFLVGFGGYDDENFYWWNIGGWGNSRHAIEKCTGGAKEEIVRGVPGKIELNRWYDIRIESADHKIHCFLDGTLIHEITDTGFAPQQPIFASAVRDSRSGDTMLKIVNVASTPQPVQLEISGGIKLGTVTKTTLAGDPMAVNTREKPQAVVPKTTPEKLANSSKLELPPHSLTVLRVAGSGATP